MENLKQLEKIWKIKEATEKNSPLIHCITNPISINQCANIVLALGAKPIMAEHPREVEYITKTSQALAVNLGNITDARIESIYLAGLTANKNKIPHIIDLVGVGISPLRLKLAQDYIRDARPSIIKGNMSEIKALLGLDAQPLGIDVGEGDKIREDNINQSLAIARKLSKETGSTIIISGKIDIISQANTSYLVRNGCQSLARITGTGCMLNTLVASLLAYGNPLDSSLLACLILTISGELAGDDLGTGSFLIGLIDQVNKLDLANLKKMAQYEICKEEIYEV